MSEEQITDIFSRVGTVVGFRLVHDKETGRPKGFGFLEYTDTDTAAAAVRNLNDHDIMGRKLRVDWSNDGPTTTAQPMADNTPAYAAPNGQDTSHDAGLPILPAGTDAAPGLSAPDAISQTLSAMPAPHLLDLISQMKGMVADNPGQVTQLFAAAPQLAYAIFQALLLLGLTDVSVLSSIVQAATAQPPPPQQYSQPPPQQNAYPGYPNYQQPAHAPTPPVQQQMYQPPQPAAPPAQPDQAALMQQLLSMSAEQIYALPAGQRDQIIALRASIGAPVT